MKTKAQKQEALQEAGKLFDKSKAMVFADFSKVAAEDLRRLRREMKNAGANFVVLKKRLANVLLKERGAEYDVRQFKGSVGTIFSSGNLEAVSGPVYKFFSNLGEKEQRDENIKKILGGYSIENKAAVHAAEILMIGQLPSREILLAQLLGMLTAPMRSFLYILDQKSKQSS